VLFRSDEEEENTFTNQHQCVPFLQTPYGAITYKIFAPEKNNLNFWCGHTNFDLRENIECPIIIDTDGVEIFDLFSAYRFRICIGLTFNEDKVKRSIAIRLGCVSPKIKNINFTELRKLRIDLKANKKPWIIYVLPNGKYEHEVYESNKIFDSNLEKYQKTQLALGGKLLYGV
jgi:hypothetical protein